MIGLARVRDAADHLLGLRALRPCRYGGGFAEALSDARSRFFSALREYRRQQRAAGMR